MNLETHILNLKLPEKTDRQSSKVRFTTMYVQSVPVTTTIVSSNPVHGKVYSVQHYVIKFVSDLRQVGGFQDTPFFSTNKTDRHNITELLLKVSLNTVTLTLKTICFPLITICKLYKQLIH
jgi:hypothetical protein